MTFPADQYNEKKAAAAAAAGNRFSGAAHKADPGKSVAAAIYGKPEEEEETPAEETARKWVDAAGGFPCVHGFPYVQINKIMIFELII